ncbi:CIC11C00000004423 [Sungouiella intermedia]|uniref:CIC11C00000004423 n=1 Tax=Sungouiella intermedia TaxID=45354 RepID=A0A1L0DLL4_9ASCO|nr:CIC11C00000004423 [[Candida] intermedia]
MDNGRKKIKKFSSAELVKGVVGFKYDLYQFWECMDILLHAWWSQVGAFGVACRLQSCISLQMVKMHDLSRDAITIYDPFYDKFGAGCVDRFI